MYKLLNAGKHPFYERGESIKEYREKLRLLKQESINLDDRFSQ